MQHDYATQYARLYRQHWWWRSREATVVQTIRRLTNLPDASHILDVGCGDALSLPMLSSLARNAQAWGIEIDPNTILPDNPLRDRIYDKPLGDAIYDGKQFNLITALDVIEHIEDDNNAIDCMTQMLKPGGILLITVPALPMLWTAHDEMNMHFRRYTRRSLSKLLQPYGQLLDCRYFYTALALPKLILSGVQRLYTSKPNTPQLPPAWLNHGLQAYCRTEWAIAKHCPMPFGSSLIAAVRKPDTAANDNHASATPALSTAA